MSRVPVITISLVVLVISSFVVWIGLDASKSMSDRFTKECASRWEGRMTRHLRQGYASICQVQDQYGWWVPEKQFVVQGGK